MVPFIRTFLKSTTRVNLKAVQPVGFLEANRGVKSFIGYQDHMYTNADPRALHQLSLEILTGAPGVSRLFLIPA
jgi:hypothetical protein